MSAVATNGDEQPTRADKAAVGRTRRRVVDVVVVEAVVEQRAHAIPLHGSIACMAKDKATITLDRAKATTARALLGAHSTSEVIDVALDRLIRAERLRADVAAYRRVPPTRDEVDLAALGDIGALADDTDWDALYAEGSA
jgi:hypothetical protein